MKKEYWMYDIESDGLLRPTKLRKGDAIGITKIHCIVLRGPNGEYYSFHDDPDILPCDGSITFCEDFMTDLQEKREGAVVFVAHNGRGYDDHIIRDYLHLELKDTLDTAVMSRLAYSDLKERDWAMRPEGMPTKLYGLHSLEAWGYRVGENKQGYDGGWETFSQEMLDYCIQDVAVLHKIFEFLHKRLEHLPDSTMKREHDFQTHCSTQELIGCSYDSKAEGLLLKRLQLAQAGNIDRIRKRWPDTTFTWRTPKKQLERTGVKSFNPRSAIQVLEYIQPLGYDPMTTTEKGAKSVTEDELLAFEKELRVARHEDDADDVRAIADYRLVSNRITKLKSGNSALTKFVKNGRIHGRITHIGTGTHRCAHSSPPLGQITSVRKPYGKEFRALFVPSDGYSLTGGDLASLELRLLAHFMAEFDGGEYAKIVLHGDPHDFNREIVCRTVPGTDRDTTKTFFYGLIYGASAKKIGQILGVSVALGKQVKEAFLTDLKGFGEVIKKLERSLLDRGMAHWEDSKYANGKPYLFLKKGASLVGLDGRRIPVRSAHSLLNFLLQSAGAVVMKETTNEFHRMIQDKGYRPHVWNCKTQKLELNDYGQLLHIHDEMQVESLPIRQLDVAVFFKQAAQSTTKTFNLRCPMDGDISYGKSWLDTH